MIFRIIEDGVAKEPVTELHEGDEIYCWQWRAKVEASTDGGLIAITADRGMLFTLAFEDGLWRCTGIGNLKSIEKLDLGLGTK